MYAPTKSSGSNCSNSVSPGWQIAPYRYVRRQSSMPGAARIARSSTYRYGTSSQSLPSVSAR